MLLNIHEMFFLPPLKFRGFCNSFKKEGKRLDIDGNAKKWVINPLPYLANVAGVLKYFVSHPEASAEALYCLIPSFAKMSVSTTPCSSIVQVSKTVAWDCDICHTVLV